MHTYTLVGPWQSLGKPQAETTMYCSRDLCVTIIAHKRTLLWESQQDHCPMPYTMHARRKESRSSQSVASSRSLGNALGTRTAYEPIVWI